MSVKSIREDNILYVLNKVNIGLLYDWKFWFFLVIIITIILVWIFWNRLKNRLNNWLTKKINNSDNNKKIKETNKKLKWKYILELNITNHDDWKEAKSFERQIKEKLLQIWKLYKKDIYVLDKNNDNFNYDDITRKVILEWNIDEKLQYNWINKVPWRFSIKFIFDENKNNYTRECKISEGNAWNEIDDFTNQIDDLIKKIFISLCISNEDYALAEDIWYDNIFSDRDKDKILYIINNIKLHSSNRQFEKEWHIYFKNKTKWPKCYYEHESRILFYDWMLEEAISITENEIKNNNTNIAAYFNLWFLYIYIWEEKKWLDSYSNIIKKLWNNFDAKFIKYIIDFIEWEQTKNPNQYLDLCKIYIWHYFYKDYNYMPYIYSYLKFTKFGKIKRFLNKILKELNLPNSQ